MDAFGKRLVRSVAELAKVGEKAIEAGLVSRSRCHNDKEQFRYYFLRVNRKSKHGKNIWA